MSRSRKFRLTPAQDKEIDRAMLLHAREQFAREMEKALEDAAAEQEPDDPPLMELMS